MQGVIIYIFSTNTKKPYFYGDTKTPQSNFHGPLEVEHWKLFKNYEAYDKDCVEERKHVQERIEERKRQEKLTRKNRLEEEKSNLTNTLPSLRGILNGSKRKQVESRLAEIDAELRRLNTE